jgi:hypothetical protein
MKYRWKALNKQNENAALVVDTGGGGCRRMTRQLRIMIFAMNLAYMGRMVLGREERWYSRPAPPER